MNMSEGGPLEQPPRVPSRRGEERAAAEKATVSGTPRLSVVICAHNPHAGRFERTLEGLRRQQLPADRWQLVVVDNRSDIPIGDRFDFTWHPDVSHVREDRLGLAHARVAGTEASTGDWCVTVDDDTVLDPDYLSHAADIIDRHPDLGIFGGRSRGEYEAEPPGWFREFPGLMAVKDRGDGEIVLRHDAARPLSFPSNAPILIAYRRAAFLETYVPHFRSRALAQQLGRRGSDLASGEDNDIAMSLYVAGYAVGYFPQLWFTHLIPGGRLTSEYVGRLLRGSTRTWVHVLALHGVCPWKPVRPSTLWLRKLRAAVRTRPWLGTAQRLKLQSSFGQLEGRADLFRQRSGGA